MGPPPAAAVVDDKPPEKSTPTPPFWRGFRVERGRSEARSAMLRPHECFIYLCLSTYLPTYLSIYPSIHPSICVLLDMCMCTVCIYEHASCFSSITLVSILHNHTGPTLFIQVFCSRASRPCWGCFLVLSSVQQLFLDLWLLGGTSGFM